MHTYRNEHNRRADYERRPEILLEYSRSCFFGYYQRDISHCLPWTLDIKDLFKGEQEGNQ